MMNHNLYDSVDRRQQNELRYRVISCVPATEYAFDTLLKLLDVSVSRDVPTAAVRCGVAPVMMVNPDFVAEHCAADEALFTLVMHELHHVLLGHTRLFPRITPAHNFAFDAVINAHLSHLFPRPAYTALFRELYPADTAPAFLLRPPEGWPARPEWPDASTAVPDRLCQLYRSLYSPGSVTYEEIFSTLTETLGRGISDMNLEPVLLGDHGEDQTDSLRSTDHEDGRLVLSAIRAIVEKWPIDQHRAGRGLSSVIERLLVPKVPFEQKASRVVRRAFESAAQGRKGRLGRKGLARTESIVRPVPDVRDRRAAVACSLGFQPLFFESSHTVPKRGPGGKVHVYLDVSGSMNPYIAPIYAGLRPFAGDMHPKVHLFSTQVRDVSVRELVNGIRLTDGGTDISPVIGHILAAGIRKALIITDGYVGPIDAAGISLLKRRGVTVVVLYTPDGWKRDLESVTAAEFELPQREVE